MKNLIISIFAVLISIQCFAQRSEKLVIDETAKKIFTSKEIKGIREMIKFVDDAVSDSVDATDINQIYHTYFDKLGVYMENDIFPPSLFKDSIKFKFLESIDKTAFDAIWRMDDYVKFLRYRARDTTLTDLHGYKTLELNLEGNYLKYLKEIGKSDRFYAEMLNQIEIAGDLPLPFWFILNHQEFDFTLFKDRLWATVFLLWLGDPFEEKVERYLKGKNN